MSGGHQKPAAAQGPEAMSRTSCQAWCGARKEDASPLAYYSRKGRIYCRYRCMRAAVKAEKPAQDQKPGGRL